MSRARDASIPEEPVTVSRTVRFPVSADRVSAVHCQVPGGLRRPWQRRAIVSAVGTAHCHSRIGRSRMGAADSPPLPVPPVLIIIAIQPCHGKVVGTEPCGGAPGGVSA